MKFKEKSKIPMIGKIPLIYINYSKISNKLDFLLSKINKMPLFHNLEENQEIYFEKTDDPNVLAIDPSDLNIESPASSIFINEKKNKNSIFYEKNDNLLENFSKLLYEEINNFYFTYLKVEKNLFKNLSSLLNQSENFNRFNLLQLVTKLKEIQNLSIDTFKLTYYIKENLNILKKICYILDFKISKHYEKGFLSYQILRNQFELPDTPLSYILKFKIIDESCFIIDDLRKKLLKHINNCDKINITKIDNENSLSQNFLSDEDVNLMNSLEKQLNDERIAKRTRNKLITNTNKYNSEIINYLDYIFKCSKIRLKYYNLSIFIRYEYSESYFRNENDKIFINSLMDEENVIRYFIHKSVFKEYINKKKSKLSKVNKSNIHLILIKYLIYQIIFCVSLFYNNEEGEEKKNENISLYIGMLFLGIFLSKIFCNILTKEGKHHFLTIILSQLFIIIGFLIPNLQLTNEKQSLLISKFFIGFASTFNLNGNYLMTYLPRALLKFYLKSYNFIKIPSNILGFLIVYIILNFNQNKIFGLIIYSDLLFLFISFILLLFIIIKFVSPSSINFSIVYDDTTTTLFEKENLSYGKKKNITLLDKKNVDKINKNLNKESELGNYVETNKIQNYIENITIKENKCCSFSYFNFISICLILISQYVNYMIIFFFDYYKILDENKESISLCIIFSLSYLFYFIFHFIKKKCKCIKNFSHYKRFMLGFLQVFQIFFIFSFLFGIKLFEQLNNINYFFNILSLFIIINCIIIENKSLKILSRIIPKTFKLCGLKIYFYLDFWELFSKSFCCLIIYYSNQENDLIDYISFFILGINVLSFVIFIFFIRNLNLNPFTKIIIRKHKEEI